MERAVTEKEIRDQVISIVGKADLNTLTKKQIRVMLEEHFGRDLTEFKSAISSWVEEAMEQVLAKGTGEPPQSPVKEPQDTEAADRELALRLQQEEEMTAKRPKRSGAEKAQKTRKPRTSASDASEKDPGRGFPECRLTPALSEFMKGRDKATSSLVTKAVWDYIKEHKLQDPNDGRWIICDDTLGSLFQKNKIHMFKIPAAIQRHLIREYE